MGQLQNISGEDLDVPPLRRTVKNGETVEVDDALLESLVWPAARWLVNGAPHPADASVAPADQPVSTPEPAPAVDGNQE